MRQAKVTEKENKVIAIFGGKWELELELQLPPLICISTDYNRLYSLNQDNSKTCKHDYVWGYWADSKTPDLMVDMWIPHGNFISPLSLSFFFSL